MLDLIDNSFPQDEKSGKKKKKQKLAKELSRCVNYVSSVGFKGFEHAKQNSKHLRAIFNWVSWLVQKTRTTLSQPIRCKTENKHELVTRVFPRFWYFAWF